MIAVKVVEGKDYSCLSGLIVCSLLTVSYVFSETGGAEAVVAAEVEVAAARDIVEAEAKARVRDPEADPRAEASLHLEVRSTQLTIEAEAVVEANPIRATRKRQVLRIESGTVVKIVRVSTVPVVLTVPDPEAKSQITAVLNPMSPMRRISPITPRRMRRRT